MERVGGRRKDTLNEFTLSPTAHRLLATGPETIEDFIGRHYGDCFVERVGDHGFDADHRCMVVTLTITTDGPRFQTERVYQVNDLPIMRLALLSMHNELVRVCGPMRRTERGA